MFRKFCGVLVCAVLLVASLFGVSEAKAEGTSSYDIVRIKLSMGSRTSTDIFIDGNYSIQEDETVILPRQLYTVKIEGSSLSLYYNNTRLYSGTTITFIQHIASEGYNNVITLNNAVHGYCSYLGDLHFTISGGYIMVVNHIYLEEYLYGVVPYEMSNSWPQEALQAQAICARTYSVRYMSGSGSYDMVDTTSNQTYHGYNAFNDNAIAAVDATAKKVLMSGGDYVATYYAASNGGQIDIPQHVWSYDNTLMPYHVIKDDPFDIANPDSKEETLVFPKKFSDTASVEYVSSTYNYIGQEMVDTLAANALQYIKVSCLPSVASKGYIAKVTGDVDIVGVNSITAHTREGNHGGVYNGDTVLYDGNDYNGENSCRYYEKATVDMTVRAKKYSEGGESIMLGDVNGDEKISISDYTMIRLHILGLSTLSETQQLSADINDDGKISISDYTMVRLHILGLSSIVQKDTDPGTLVTEEVTVQFDIDLHEMDNMEGLYRSFYSSSLRLFAVEETDTKWEIHQRRFGHGIGMSQRGAQQMANTINPATVGAPETPDGRVYNGEEICLFYYPNTTASALSIEKPALAALATAPSLGATNASVTGCEWLNVRATPDTSQSAIGRIPAGTRLEVTDDFVTDGWHMINYGGTNAYVSATYMVPD